MHSSISATHYREERKVGRKEGRKEGRKDFRKEGLQVQPLLHVYRPEKCTLTRTAYVCICMLQLLMVQGRSTTWGASTT